MSYVSEFISWCQIWKEEAKQTFCAFLWYCAGVVIFEASPLFMIIPFFLFLLTQYFHYVAMTEYSNIFYKLPKEEYETEKMLHKIADTIPIISFFSAKIFIFILSVVSFF